MSTQDITEARDTEDEQYDNNDQRNLRRSWEDAASHGGICRTPSCHSRDSVRPTTIAGEEESPILCAYCRRMYFEVSS